MVATFSKPSSGAGVVWMDTPLNGLGSYPGHKNNKASGVIAMTSTVPFLNFVPFLLEQPLCLFISQFFRGPRVLKVNVAQRQP